MGACNHFFEQLHDAIAKGFTHDFNIFPSGLVRCLATGKEYTLDQLTIAIHTCTDCKMTFYLITAADGTMGTLAEFWDI